MEKNKKVKHFCKIRIMAKLLFVLFLITTLASSGIVSAGNTGYTVNLRWVSADCSGEVTGDLVETTLMKNRTLEYKYQVSFSNHSGENYDTGEIRIELPRYLFYYRNPSSGERMNNGVEFSDIGLVDSESELTENNPFTYTITDDSIVITNGRYVPDAANIMFQVSYEFSADSKIPAYETFCLSADVSADGVESRTNTLNLRFLSQINLGLQTFGDHQLNQWEYGLGNRPADFDDHYYYWFQVRADTNTVQPAFFEYNAIAHGGTVLGYWSNSYVPSNAPLSEQSNYHSISANVSETVYILAKYPKGNGTGLELTINCVAHGLDGDSDDSERLVNAWYMTTTPNDKDRSEWYETRKQAGSSTNNVYGELLWYGQDAVIPWYVSANTDIVRLNEPYYLEIIDEGPEMIYSGNAANVMDGQDFSFETFSFSGMEIEYPDEIMNPFSLQAEIHVRYGAENDWVYLKTVAVDEKYTFPEGCTAIKLRIYANGMINGLQCNLSMKIKSESPKVQYAYGTFGRKPIRVKNYCSMKAYESNGEEIDMNLYQIGSSNDTMQLSLAEGTNSLSLSNYSATNYVSRELVEVNYTLTATEKVSGALPASIMEQMLEDGSAVERRTATFYELLPLGYTYHSYTAKDINGKSDTVKSKVEVIPDYRHSGRTMVIIRVDYSGERNIKYSSGINTGFIIDMKCIVPWGNLIETSQYIPHRAYQTDTDMLGSSYADTGIGAQAAVRELFYNLADNTEVNTDLLNTIYGQGGFSRINVAVSTISGLQKTVRGELDITEIYRNSISVMAGQQYAYRLSTANSIAGTMSDVVLFDRIEAGINSGWRGVFEHLDVTLAQSLGIQPTIYYSKQSDAAYDLLDEPSGWTTEQPDAEDVRAIAVDLSKKADGSDYIFAANTGTSVFLYMRAPAEMPKSNPFTKNHAVFSSTFQLTGKEPEQAVNETSATTIQLAEQMPKVSVSYEWLSKDNPEDVLPPETQRLEYGSLYMPVQQQQTADSLELFTFKGWYYDKEQTQPATANMTVTEDMTLYGSWTRGTVQVSYRFTTTTRPPDVAVVPATERVGKGLPYTAQECVSGDENYRFSGWYLDSALKEPFVDGTPIRATTTLNGRWDRVYLLTVRYVDPDDNEIAESYQAYVPSGLTDIPIADIEGYTSRKEPYRLSIYGQTTQTIIYDPDIYQLSIEYRFTEGGEAFPTYQEELAYGTEYSIPSPALEHYYPDIENVEGRINENTEITVYYHPVCDYSIEYYFDGVLDNTLTETLQAREGDVIDRYPDKAKVYHRLERVDTLPLTVSAEGENIIRIYYVTESVDFEIPATGEGPFLPLVAVLVLSCSCFLAVLALRKAKGRM